MASHEEIIEKLKKYIIGFSGWSDDEKKRWRSRVELLSPEGALFLQELFEESPMSLSRTETSLKTLYLSLRCRTLGQLYSASTWAVAPASNTRDAEQVIVIQHVP